MNERRDIESTIIASLLKKPELIESYVLDLICSITTISECLWSMCLKSVGKIIKKYS